MLRRARALLTQRSSLLLSGCLVFGLVLLALQLRPFWRTTVHGTRATPAPAISANSTSLAVLTFATHGSLGFCKTLHLLAQHHYHVHVLGFLQYQDGYKFLGNKILATHKALQQMHPRRVVLFVDAFDCMMTRPAKELLEEFLGMGRELVFSTERGCWPYINRDNGVHLCTHFYPDATTTHENPYRFINTGAWMGYAEAALRITSFIVAELGAAIGRGDDQGYVTNLFVCDYLNSLASQGLDTLEARTRMPVAESFQQVPLCERTGVVAFNISLDYQCRLFQGLQQSVVGKERESAQGVEFHLLFNHTAGAWQNIHTGSFPIILHCNGGSKGFFDAVFSKLPVLKLEPDFYDKYLYFDGQPFVRFADVCDASSLALL